MTTIDQSAVITGKTAVREKQFSYKQQQRFWGWVFLSPWVIGFLAFTFIPIIASFIFTFTDFKLADPSATKFNNFDNYRDLFNDPLVEQSLIVTFTFAAIALPLSMIVPIFVATLLNSKALAGKRFFRTLFYLPYMIPAVSAIYIWGNFLNAEAGWMNRILAQIGINGPNWTNDITFVYPALYMIELWGIGNAMLTTLATMQGVPTDLYEAAEVDGAGPFIRWRKITLPMISPVIFYNLILNAIGIMQYFVVPYVLSGGTGRPGNRTYFFNMHLYKTAFTFQDMGYGATLAWVIFVIALVMTLFIFWTSRWWVFYAGER